MFPGEAFPVAARLSEMGMPVFCLNYRVAGKEPLFPKPMEDLSAAYRFLKDHEDQFDIDARHYAVGGFSAGGHLAACWGLRDWDMRNTDIRLQKSSCWTIH